MSFPRGKMKVWPCAGGAGPTHIQFTVSVLFLLPEDHPPDYLLDAGVR